MATVVRMKRRAVCDISEVVAQLQADTDLNTYIFLTDIISGEQSALMLPNNIGALLCYEKYYVRANGLVSLTILIKQEGEEQKATIISFMDHVVFFFSAEKSFSKMAISALKKLGFEQYEKLDSSLMY
ncbi:MAG: hypothetical protein IKX10_00025 [Lachnospiraceae bacterium]|nr:hypothetical protein [Lachnospiraceae bacterium]